jgi:2-dehydropantoate 2-reductase
VRICVFGAGAIGGYLGGCLAARWPDDVVLVARGERLAALRRNGIEIRGPGTERRVVAVRCTDDPTKLPLQDVVFLTTKAHDAPRAADTISGLLGPESVLVTAMNGVPWWYFDGVAGPHQDHRLLSVDPDGALARSIASTRVLGAVVWTAAVMRSPAVIDVDQRLRLPIGEPSGATSARAETLVGRLRQAGIESSVVPDIRAEIWLKLWGNLAFNPVSVLTRATLAGIARDPGGRLAVRAMMVEAEQVARALGVRLQVDVDRRIAMAESIGTHTTSSLQDLDAGKEIELAALTGAVLEMAAMTGVATPTIAMIHGLTQLRVRTRDARMEA